MTITPHRVHLPDLERRLDLLERRHAQIKAQLHAITEAVNRTDAGVTHLCWTLDRITAALGIDDK